MDFGDFTKSDPTDPSAIQRATDVQHVVAPAAAMAGGWCGFAADLAVFCVLHVVRFRRDPTWRVAGDKRRSTSPAPPAPRSAGRGARRRLEPS
ncbi:hypothetical protein [Rubrimonas cliftonensis]|uniref:Uncharacterized protein n=1 Tax=Rubrimonas cliftonensis TaxID=89524 RepID=A0A1H4EKQ0_9RHOB|nr:hypothetical protein [Rubrimonas cliftonensis]SEA85150.1 hypothetical protein SAMN05444370_11452 [Rubrimonas cliftonensis]